MKNDTLAEGFEIVVCAHDDENYDWEKEEYTPKYLEEVVGTLTEPGISREEVTHERTGIGVGAEADATKA